MTAVTATPRPTRGASVLLKITGAPAGAVTITRNDANGARPVRLQAGQTPIAGATDVDDYEAALVGTIRYDVRDSAGVITTVTTSLEPYGPFLPHLVVVVNPQLRVDASAVITNEHQRDADLSLHKVIGRPDKIPTVMGAMGLREGTLLIEPSSGLYADARAVEALAGNGDTLMLRQGSHAGMDMYLVTGTSKIAGDRQVAAPDGGARTIWRVALDYVEVGVPTAPLSGAVGWTYAASLTYSGTYVQSQADFATYNDLFVGPPA